MITLPFRLMLITKEPPSDWASYLDFIERCCLAGIDAVQLRSKKMPQKALLDFALALKKKLTLLNIPLIVNDYIWLYKAIDADGLHLGQEDGCIKKARRIIGEKALLGLSVNTLKNVHDANTLPINYVGVGPIFSTKNKANCMSSWGIKQLKQANKESTHPCLAIGGINSSNVESIIHSGVSGIACIGAFHDTQNLTETLAFFQHALGENHE